jgi:hypothetical protein
VFGIVRMLLCECFCVGYSTECYCVRYTVRTYVEYLTLIRCSGKVLGTVQMIGNTVFRIVIKVKGPRILGSNLSKLLMAMGVCARKRQHLLGCRHMRRIQSNQSLRLQPIPPFATNHSRWFTSPGMAQVEISRATSQ